MIARIIELSLKNRALVILLTLALVGAGIWSTSHIRVDAIPDLSDVQVIVTTEFPGQNPEIVDQQVTYPLSSTLLAVPGAKVVRGISMFEQSFVYILFDDGTDIYWARARVQEYLNSARDRLPKGAEPRLGPDATGVGWVYQYALVAGYFSPDHPNGFWHDPQAAEGKGWYASREDAPEDARDRLTRVRAFEKAGRDPISGKELTSCGLDLGDLRALQDWHLRFPLSSVDDVSEVASIGGLVKQYQVVLDPVKLQSYGLPIPGIIEAVQKSNNDVGGSVLELSENEYMVRSRGYLRGLEDLAQVPVGRSDKGVPILLGDVSVLQLGGESRRGVGELDGKGEAVGGIVVARFGANAFKVIGDVKRKLAELEDTLPPGVAIKATYDRSALITRAVHTLRNTLIEEIVVVGLICMLFLLHLRSELVAVFVVPTSVICALLLMQILGINANIMSLGGIAISIGVLVDSAIISVENAHKHLDREEESLHAGNPPTPRIDIMFAAAKEVGPQLFFSLLIITVSFLPVFMLEGEAGRLFKPLAFTKTFAMAAAAVLSITIVPVLMHSFIVARLLPKRWGRAKNTLITLSAMLLPAAALWLIADKSHSLHDYRWWMACGWAALAAMLLLPQKIIHEQRNPLSKVLQGMYAPFFGVAMRHPWLTVLAAAALLASTWYPLSRLGREFMPPLDEGDFLYMPTTAPSVSITKAKEILQQTDKLIKTVPEVISVHGKVGRANTATDPAPLSMIETLVQLNPDRSQWRKRSIATFCSDWPGWLKWPFTSTFWPESRPITTDELRFGWADADGTEHQGIDSIVRLPGMANSWPHPIEARLSMLATGIKTPVGIKIIGPDLKMLGELADRAAAATRSIPGTVSSYAEATMGGYYLDIDIDRAAAARYGLTVGDVQEVIQAAIGGMNITTVVRDQERFPLNIRYNRDYRDDIPALENILIPVMSEGKSAQIPLGQLATFRTTSGAPMIRSENAARSAWVFIDVAGSRDLGGYISEARAVIAREVALPQGYSLSFTGQFEFWQKTVPRLMASAALALVAIIVLLYASSRSWFRVAVVMLAVPFSLIGAAWFMHALNYNLSLASVIGMIALAGLDAETGMVMLLYLDNSIHRRAHENRLHTREDLWHAVHDGAVMRIRPKAMTVAAAMIGLVPILWSDGTGADTMRRIAAPMIGGLAVSFLMELIVYPVVFYLVRGRSLPRG